MRALETLLIAAAVAATNGLVALLAVPVLLWQVAIALLHRVVPPKPPRPPRAVLITGASSGIGRALAHKYARPGAVVVLTGRNEQRLNEVADECRALGAEVVAATVDVGDRAAMEAFVHEQDAQHHLDLVVANAGVSAGVIGYKGLEDNTKELNRINVDGVYHTILPLLASFRERRTGQLVVVSSLSAFFDYPRGLAYSAGKSSLVVFWRGLRHIMRGYNVRVNAICPGFVETAFTPHTRARGASTPFLLKDTDAADIIYNGLANDDPVIAFPLPLYVVTMVLHSLPPQAVEALLRVVAPLNMAWHQLG